MKTIKLPQHTKQNEQNGVVLIVALVFLVILTILGVTTMEGAMQETKLASNNQERNFALRAAEIGLLQTEAYIQTLENPTGFTPNAVAQQFDAVTGIARDHDIEAETSAIQIIYKGNFPRPRMRNASGQKVQIAVFEIISTGQSAGDDQKPAYSTLRNGVSLDYFSGQGGNPHLVE